MGGSLSLKCIAKRDRRGLTAAPVPLRGFGLLTTAGAPGYRCINLLADAWRVPAGLAGKLRRQRSTLNPAGRVRPPGFKLVQAELNRTSLCRAEDQCVPAGRAGTECTYNHKACTSSSVKFTNVL